MPDTPPRSSNAGGFLIAAGAIVGAVVGTIVAEPTVGLLVGLGIGVALAGLLWLRDRPR